MVQLFALVKYILHQHHDADISMMSVLYENFNHFGVVQSL